MAADGQRGTAGEVFVAFLRLGLTAFGGPVAHLGYFRTAFVARRQWLDEGQFAEIVALCSFLPGPTSSQTGVAIGLGRAGWAGALAAWLGFTLPSAALMIAVALAAGSLHGPVADHIIHGLKLAAVAIVAQAVVGMARTLTPDWPRRGIAVAAAGIVAFGGPFGQVAAILAGAAAGIALDTPATAARQPRDRLTVPRVSVVTLTAFAVLLAALPFLAAASPHLAVAAVAFRAGALVFGGGHVVLPLLQAGFVPRWLSSDAFLAGYGAAQALPGPLFAFAAYLGTAAGGVGTGLVALVAIFLPGMLLLIGVLPLWRALQARPGVRAAVRGVNAAVVGILAAALVSPVGTGAIHGVLDLALAAAGLAALLAKAPPWAVVAGLVAAAMV
jgi:chromate transporter